MAEKKKQHYVPQFYLRFFTDSSNRFTVCNTENRTIHSNVPYGSQCYKDYFYGKDKLLENKFSDLERKWNETITKANNTQPLSKIDCDNLKEFMVYQRQRTLADNQFTKQEEIESHIVCMKMLLEHRGIPFDETVKNICYKEAEKRSRELGSMKFVDECLECILDLEILIVNYSTHRMLISSDVPVIALNPFCPRTVGYGSMGLILLVPISSHHLLIAYDKKMYPRYNGKQYLTLNNENEVLHLNILQMISAHKVFFGLRSNEMSEFTSQNWAERGKNRKQKPISVYGTDNEQYIVSTPRRVIHDYGFSFGHVRPEFDKVPLYVRDAGSRSYDRKWEEKYRSNIIIMPDVSTQIPHKSACSYTKKELRVGYEKMLKMALIYWRLQ